MQLRSALLLFFFSKEVAAALHLIREANCQAIAWRHHATTSLHGFINTQTGHFHPHTMQIYIQLNRTGGLRQSGIFLV